jgi:hypothetical protein
MIGRYLGLAGAVFAFVAAAFWFLSAARKLPPIVAHWDETPTNDPFYAGLISSANLNTWAAAFSGLSALCTGISEFVQY